MSGAAVVDASVALAWILPGDEAEAALPLRERAANEPSLSLRVPPIFWYEVGNVLWQAIRRGRIGHPDAAAALEALRAFAIETGPADVMACLELAVASGVSVYDASYLVLALEASIPLWTLDRGLAAAATAAGVQVEP